jgi:hypothetical protein
MARRKLGARRASLLGRRRRARHQRDEQVGRWSGKDVVQVGARPDGTPTRWRFTEITPDSFHWIGESLLPDGQTWKLGGEFRAKRMR